MMLTVNIMKNVQVSRTYGTYKGLHIIHVAVKMAVKNNKNITDDWNWQRHWHCLSILSV